MIISDVISLCLVAAKLVLFSTKFTSSCNMQLSKMRLKSNPPRTSALKQCQNMWHLIDKCNLPFVLVYDTEINFKWFKCQTARQPVKETHFQGPHYTFGCQVNISDTYTHMQTPCCHSGRWGWPVHMELKLQCWWMLTCIQRWWMLVSLQVTDGVERVGGVTVDLGWYSVQLTRNLSLSSLVPSGQCRGLVPTWSERPVIVINKNLFRDCSQQVN